MDAGSSHGNSGAEAASVSQDNFNKSNKPLQNNCTPSCFPTHNATAAGSPESSRKSKLNARSSVSENNQCEDVDLTNELLGKFVKI